MDNLFNALLLLVLVICAILLSWILSYYIRSDRTESNNRSASAIILNSSCNVSLDLLPDASSLICCRNNFYSDLRYDPDNNVCISSTPEFWQDGCNGFCPDNLVSEDGLTCLLEPSNQSYVNCIARNRPNGCTGLSKPVARRDTNYMYIVSAGSNLCPPEIRYSC